MEQGMDLSVMASTSASHNSVVVIPSKFHPQVIFASEALVWIEEQKTFIRARAVWDIQIEFSTNLFSFNVSPVEPAISSSKFCLP